MAYTICARRGPIAEFQALNRVYEEGELLLEEQGDGSYKLKAGDGTTAYNSLPYVFAAGAGSNSFATIAVPAQTSVTAESTADTLTLSGINGTTITTDAPNDIILIQPTYGSIANTVCQGNDGRLSNTRTPTGHNTSHGAGGGDAIKLDALAVPDDVTTLNASTLRHGLLPKLSGDTGQYLNGVGTWATVSASGGLDGVRNVKAYGAIGNGSANDTAAFQAAIVADSIVYVPPGTYSVSPTAITGLHNVHIVGVGKGYASKIVLRTAGTLFTIDNSPYFAFRGLTICDESTFTGGIGIHVGAGSTGQIKDCTFFGFHNNAVRFIGTQQAPLSASVIRDSWFLSNGKDQASAQLYLYECNDFSITGNQLGSYSPASAYPGIGVKLENSRNGTFTDNMTWLNILGCQIIYGDYNRIVSNRFEESFTHGIAMSGCQHVIFTNNWINYNSRTAANTYDGCVFYDVGHSVVADNIVYAWAYPTTLHRISYSFESACTDNIVTNNKSLYSGTAHVALSSGSVGNSFDGDRSFVAISAVAGGATVYLGPSGAGLSAGAADIIAARMVFIRLVGAVDIQPAGSETVIFTLMVDGVASSLATTVTGMSYTNASVGYVEIAVQASVCVRVQYSASAASSIPRCLLQGMRI